MVKRASGLVPTATFLVGKAEALPVPTHSADILTAAGSLNFADLSLFFPEAVRVLRPEGVLVIYDFSEGRRCRESARLDTWYSEILRRYPPRPNFGQAISPDSLKSVATGFRLRAQEQFEIGLELTPTFYLDYVLTETNVAHCIASGVSEQEIRTWCGETLGAIFSGNSQEVLFEGYIAYLHVESGSRRGRTLGDAPKQQVK